LGFVREGFSIPRAPKTARRREGEAVRRALDEDFTEGREENEGML
jgi:hypothetical protein